MKTLQRRATLTYALTYACCLITLATAACDDGDIDPGDLVYTGDTDDAGDDDNANTGDGDPNISGACSGNTNVGIGPTQDAIGETANVLVCYYPQATEGYCRMFTSPEVIASFYSSGKSKSAIGCADAVVLTNAQCPSSNVFGRCSDNSIETERVYYTCNKFEDPAAHCAQIGGKYAQIQP